MIDYVIIWWFLSSVMVNYSIWLNFWKWVFIIWGFCYKLYVQVNSWFLKYNWTILNALEHASFVYYVHASYIVFFSLTLSNAVCLWFSLFSVFGFFSVYSFQSLESWLGRLTHRTSTSSSTPAYNCDRFQTEKNKETYKKLNIFKLVWAERKVVLDGLDSEIRRNFEHKG